MNRRFTSCFQCLRVLVATYESDRGTCWACHEQAENAMAETKRLKQDNAIFNAWRDRLDQHNSAEEAGIRARTRGQGRDANPYIADSDEGDLHTMWLAGWCMQDTGMRSAALTSGLRGVSLVIRQCIELIAGYSCDSHQCPMTEVESRLKSLDAALEVVQGE